jgi:hypothetical protein
MNDVHNGVQSPEHVQRVSTRVRVYTPSGVVEGSRLSDSLRNAATGERYMLLTDVTLSSAGDRTDTATFVLISTQAASVIIPLDEQ